MSAIPPPPTPPATADKQAMAWLVRLHSGACSAVERQAFEAWLAQSETHWRAYQKATAFWRELGDLQTLPFPELAAARARVAGTTLPRPGRWPAFSAALALVVSLGAVVALTSLWSWNSTDTYRTAKGERKAVTLPDGSRLELNTDTALTVSFDRTARRMDLLRGEVIVTVTQASVRPFEVFAGAGRIRDLGTQFDVYAQPDQVSVAVLEGAVSVAGSPTTRPQKLTHGQQLSYDGRGVLSAVERSDLAALTAWREGRVVFKARPLREVLAQIGRYHAVEFILGDARLEDLKVSGTFITDDLKVILDTIAATLPVQVEDLGGGTLRLHRIHSSAAPAAGRAALR